MDNSTNMLFIDEKFDSIQISVLESSVGIQTRVPPFDPLGEDGGEDSRGQGRGPTHL